MTQQYPNSQLFYEDDYIYIADFEHNKIYRYDDADEYMHCLKLLGNLQESDDIKNIHS